MERERCHVARHDWGFPVGRAFSFRDFVNAEVLHRNNDGIVLRFNRFWCCLWWIQVGVRVCQKRRSIQIYDERRGKSALRLNKARATGVWGVELGKLEKRTHQTGFVYSPAEMWWHAVTHGRESEMGNWRMEWVASTLHTTSKLGVSSITTADAHTSAASSRLNWLTRWFKWTRPFRRKKKSGFCPCAITFQTQSTLRNEVEDHRNMQVSVLVCWKPVSDLLYNPRINDQHISSCQELPSC
jgi:hypothetical protein